MAGAFVDRESREIWKKEGISFFGNFISAYSGRTCRHGRIYGGKRAKNWELFTIEI